MQLAPSDLLRQLPPPPGPALALASALLSRLTRAVDHRHPGLLRRLGPEAEKRLLIDARELPALLVLCPSARRLTLHPRGAPPPAHDAAIRGRLSAFLAMLHGAADGDALFFSGDLAISGDTSAVLALRNALDDAEIDLAEELAALTHAPRAALHRLAAGIGRRTGLVLHRPAGTGAA